MYSSVAPANTRGAGAATCSAQRTFLEICRNGGRDASARGGSRRIDVAWVGWRTWARQSSSARVTTARRISGPAAASEAPTATQMAKPATVQLPPHDHLLTTALDSVTHASDALMSPDGCAALIGALTDPERECRRIHAKAGRRPCFALPADGLTRSPPTPGCVLTPRRRTADAPTD
jgi:hypothetical protein